MMEERLEFRRLQEENAILKAEITAYKVQNQNLQNDLYSRKPKCAGKCYGEEDVCKCPIRDNCKNYKEGTKESIEMFYTYAFGCDDYDPINEQI
jgi:hypothetical protein